MKAIRHAIRRRERQVSEHALYRWMSSEVPPEEAFRFAPLFVNFIMAFSDMNKWLMRYAAPGDAFELAINSHTHEDQTHSRLFLEDWAKLEFDAALGWRASDMIWWYYAAGPTEPFRAFGMELMSMVARHPDPWLRFPVMEAIEACGHAFFSCTAKIATALGERTGHDYRYFGPYHLARETGQLHGAEAVFARVELAPGQRERALRLVDRVFDMFLAENDLLLAYARLDGGRRAQSPLPPAHDPPRAERGQVAEPDPAVPARAGGGELPPSSARLREVLERCLVATSRHPLFEWLRSAELAPLEKLRLLVILWVPDIMGYRDLSHYALPCPQGEEGTPPEPRERAINRWVERLSSHAALFIRDWRRLGLDDWVGWSAGATLAFYSFGPETELARENYMRFIRWGYTIENPAVRYWFIAALEATGLPFFAETRRLASAVEPSVGALDYLGDRHDLAHPAQPADAEADAVDFEREPLSAADEQLAAQIVASVFGCIQAQYSETLERLSSKTAGGERP